VCGIFRSDKEEEKKKQMVIGIHKKFSAPKNFLEEQAILTGQIAAFQGCWKKNSRFSDTGFIRPLAKLPVTILLSTN
jgi:hypothetical protein